MMKNNNELREASGVTLNKVGLFQSHSGPLLSEEVGALSKVVDGFFVSVKEHLGMEPSITLGNS